MSTPPDNINMANPLAAYPEEPPPSTRNEAQGLDPNQSLMGLEASESYGIYDEVDFDIEDALGDAFVSEYDPEDDIYDTTNVRQIFGGGGNTVQAGIDYHGAIESEDDGGINEEEGGGGGSLINQLGEAFQNAITDPNNPMTPAGTLETTKAVVGGAVEGAILAPANFLDYVFTEAAVGVGGMVTGKTREELETENPNLFTAVHREIPEWLQTETIGGALVNNTSQFIAGWVGVGALGKVSRAQELIGGAASLASKPKWLMNVSKAAGAIGEELPAIRTAAQTVLNGAQITGKVFAVDTLAFDAQEGNLANLLAVITEGKPWLGHGLWEYLAVDANDSELEGRLKNGIAGQLGEGVGTLVFQLAKTLKSVQKVKGLKEDLDKGSATFKSYIEALTEVDERGADFERALDEIAKEDPQALLDTLLRKTPPEEIGEGVPVAASKPATSKGVEIIQPTDAPEDAAKRIQDSYKSIYEQRMESNQDALEQMVEQQTKQGTKAFNKKEFAQSLVNKIKNGEPIDIEQEILNHTSSEVLTDIDSYVTNFKNILEATTTEVKRYEGNRDLVARVKEILGYDLGQDAWMRDIDGTKLNNHLDTAFESLVKRGIKSLTQDEEALLEMMGFKLLKEHLIPNQVVLLGAARHEAVIAGNKSLRAKIDNQLQKLITSQKQAEALFDKYLSNAGRRLQAGGQAATSLDDGVSFMETYAKAKQGLPLLAQDGAILSEGDLDILSTAARDFFGMGGTNQVGRIGQIGKHLNMFMNAVQKGGSYGLGVTQELFYNNVLFSLETLKAIGFMNAGMKGFELGGRGVGAFVRGNKAHQIETMDEASAFIRYLGEGILGGLSVFRTGQKHSLDYTPPHPRIISSEGLRQHFGASFGDAIKAEIFGVKPGAYMDWVWDKIGKVVTIPTAHLIGGVDTVTKVANTRANVYRELKALGRHQGLAEDKAHEFAIKNQSAVADDLILGRAQGFGPGMQRSQNFLTQEQLKNLDIKIQGSTDQIILSHPLKASKDPYYNPGSPLKQTNSDRWVFSFFSKVDDAARMLGPIGTWEMPFVRVFANSVQYGVDSLPLLNLVSPHNRSILMGEMGEEAKEAFLGKTLLASALGMAGIGAAQTGLLAPVSGSAGSKKVNKQLTGQDTYTLNFPMGDDKGF